MNKEIYIHKLKNGQVVQIQEFDCALVHSYITFDLKSLDNLLAPIIRWFTKCYYNHVCTFMFYEGEMWVFEAVGKGVMPTKTLKKWLSEGGLKREYAILRPEDAYDAPSSILKVRLNNLVGKKYDFTSLLFYQLINQISKRWIGRKGEKSKKRIYCSELYAWLRTEIFLKPWQTDPEDIWSERRMLLKYESNKKDRVKFHSKRKQL